MAFNWAVGSTRSSQLYDRSCSTKDGYGGARLAWKFNHMELQMKLMKNNVSSLDSLALIDVVEEDAGHNTLLLWKWPWKSLGGNTNSRTTVFTRLYLGARFTASGRNNVPHMSLAVRELAT
jgi:hypothetical protein